MTAAAPRRVAVWGTGGVGAIALDAIARRADLDLVSVHVHDPAKAGRDAGELVGRPAVGVSTSDDLAVLHAAVDGMVATTMRIVNAIVAVGDAPPGLVSSLDLPLTLPTGA
jgi:hypothetical protein